MANTTGQKYGGRKGTPNRVTKEMRPLLKNILHEKLENIDELLNQLEPEKQLEFILKLMPYVFPKVKNIPIDHNEPFQWNMY